MSFTFTTAKNLVEIKIQRNNTLIDLLETESNILKKSILVNYRLVENNKEKIELIKKINEVELQQTQTYCSMRQDLVKDLTEQVNNNSADIKGLYEEILNLKNNCSKFLTQIKELNDQIPNQTIVTNYKVPVKLDNCHGFETN